MIDLGKVEATPADRRECAEVSESRGITVEEICRTDEKYVLTGFVAATAVSQVACHVR